MKDMAAPARPPRPSVLHTLTVMLRCTLAVLVTLVLSPITAPAFLQLPSCVATRWLERLSVGCLRLIASVADVHCTLHPRLTGACDTVGDVPGAVGMRMPLVRFWSSTLADGRVVRTYDQAGRWMADGELRQLALVIRGVAVDSIGRVPTHRLFEGVGEAGAEADMRVLRAVFANRVVSVVSDEAGALGFTAMVYIPWRGGETIVHLGLTMVALRARGHRLQTALFSKCVVMPLLNLGRMGYVVTNCAASPAGIGAVCDYFVDAWPTYDGSARCAEWHLAVAAHVLGRFRSEFGCSTLATFDAGTFVVVGSNASEGGGTVEFQRRDGSAVSRHRDDRCNRFVERVIDLRRGDELFQVARMHLVATALRYLALAWRKMRLARKPPAAVQ